MDGNASNAQSNCKDEPIGPRSKVDLHIWENIVGGEKILHRAFSVFLINKDNKLLLQQRASSKITFPDYWANTCCSHPWHTKDEMERTNDLGVKRAAIRKLLQPQIERNKMTSNCASATN